MPSVDPLEERLAVGDDVLRTGDMASEVAMVTQAQPRHTLAPNRFCASLKSDR